MDRTENRRLRATRPRGAGPLAVLWLGAAYARRALFVSEILKAGRFGTRVRYAAARSVAKAAMTPRLFCFLAPCAPPRSAPTRHDARHGPAKQTKGPLGTGGRDKRS